MVTNMELVKKWRARRSEMTKRALAIGMNSWINIDQDRHIVMLDYDVSDRGVVVRSVEELQAFWALSDAYLFKTKKGYHVFFWYDIVPYERLRMIIDFARDVDPMYKHISRYYDHKTIRVAGKYKEQDIKFMGIVPGRKPMKDEWQTGELKRMEHLSLVDPDGMRKVRTSAKQKTIRKR